IFQHFYRPENRLRHHYHSCPASESIIINTFIPVFGKIMKVNYIDLHKALIPGTFYYGIVQRTFKKFRAYRKNIYSHQESICVNLARNKLRRISREEER